MKKTIVIAAVALAATCFAKTTEQIHNDLAKLETRSARNEYCKALTTEEWRALADEYVAVFATNASAAVKFVPSPPFYMANPWINIPAAKSLAAEYDEKFAAVMPTFYKDLPKSSERWLASTNAWQVAWVADHPTLLAAIRRTKNGYPFKELSVGEMSNIFAEEVVAKSSKLYGAKIEMWKKYVLDLAPRAVKIQLRKQQKSFVGNTLVQDAVDELTAALDAPKLAGLKEWCAKWCPSWTWVDVTWMPESEFEKYKEDLFVGDKTMKSEDNFRLCAYMGVTAYNKWVAEYNGTIEE